METLERDTHGHNRSSVKRDRRDRFDTPFSSASGMDAHSSTVAAAELNYRPLVGSSSATTSRVEWTPTRERAPET